LEALARAKEMIANKVSGEEVRQATGWELTPHGHWRYEISDNKARLSPEAQKLMEEGYVMTNQNIEPISYTYQFGKTESPAKHFMEHPELFEAYPDLAYNLLKGARVPEYRQSTGSYGPAQGFTVKSPNPESAVSTGLHEAQHWIQRQEGWPSGGSPAASRYDLETQIKKVLGDQKLQLGAAKHNRSFAEEGTIKWDSLKDQEKRLRQSIKEIKNELKEENLRKAAWEDYRKTAGEVESRNTQLRRHLTDEQRRQTPPAKTQDEPYDEQMVKYRHNANGGSIVDKAIMVTYKKAASRRGRPSNS
jgi:hypothetical protein